MIAEDLLHYQPHMQTLRDRLEAGIEKLFHDNRINGDRDARLPNTSSVGFKGLNANEILSQLTGVAASAGAACHSEHVAISHVLEAMNVPREYAVGTLRFSVGRSTTASEIDQTLRELAELKVLRALRRERV
jgi:cysteine desulfurase